MSGPIYWPVLLIFSIIFKVVSIPPRCEPGRRDYSVNMSCVGINPGSPYKGTKTFYRKQLGNYKIVPYVCSAEHLQSKDIPDRKVGFFMPGCSARLPGFVMKQNGRLPNMF